MVGSYAVLFLNSRPASSAEEPLRPQPDRHYPAGVLPVEVSSASSLIISYEVSSAPGRSSRTTDGGSVGEPAIRPKGLLFEADNSFLTSGGYLSRNRILVSCCRVRERYQVSGLMFTHPLPRDRFHHLLLLDKALGDQIFAQTLA